MNRVLPAPAHLRSRALAMPSPLAHTSLRLLCPGEPAKAASASRPRVPRPRSPPEPGLPMRHSEALGAQRAFIGTVPGGTQGEGALPAFLLISPRQNFTCWCHPSLFRLLGNERLSWSSESHHSIGPVTPQGLEHMQKGTVFSFSSTHQEPLYSIF